ncbi:MAG TPA: FAD-dependent oxidoreductase [Burkholderiales bacterium]|nr:FAD-dependent oxidoreductase [Burkholderiales bacterium]
MRIAVIGAGIAGNVAAWHLHRAGHEVTVFEAGSHVGGHTHTHAVDGLAIDTGFIVYNERTYPNFSRLLEQLQVASQPSSMSFSVRNEASGLEWGGATLNTLFAQRRNLLRPRFHRMIADILRFNREAPRLLGEGGDATLGEYLARERYCQAFLDDYLVPMGAAIWSTHPSRMLGFPARFFVRFLHNHGMLSVNDRPQWRVVRGGSARYVERLTAPFRHRIRIEAPVAWLRRLPDGVLLRARSVLERFDHAFVACHADQALALLADATPLEREVLGAIRYQENEAVLHTDASLLPRARRAWAAWNYHVLREPGERVALTYNMNILQGLAAPETYCVTLNRTAEIRPDRIVKRLVYHHPLFTPEAVAAQARQRELNAGRTFYCGAYWRFGFHEDGVVSALAALDHFEESVRAQRGLSRVA